METTAPRSAQAPTRILLVEDQTSIREMLGEVLARLEGFEVVGQAGDIVSGIKLARETQPDLVVLDWLYPEGTGLDFLQALRPNRLLCRVLVLTGHTTEEAVAEALAHGARGFFEKIAPLEDFIHAVRTVAAGGAYFGPEASAIVDRMVRAKGAKVTRAEATPAPAEAAPPRSSETLPPFSFALS